jgi:hypothetical protein
MELRRIIQTEQAALHRAAGGEFGEHRGKMTAGALDAAGRVQFRKYADEHWLSLPSAATERKRSRSLKTRNPGPRIRNEWRLEKGPGR